MDHGEPGNVIKVDYERFHKGPQRSRARQGMGREATGILVDIDTDIPFIKEQGVTAMVTLLHEYGYETEANDLTRLCNQLIHHDLPNSTIYVSAMDFVAMVSPDIHRKIVLVQDMYDRQQVSYF